MFLYWDDTSICSFCNFCKLYFILSCRKSYIGLRQENNCRQTASQERLNTVNTSQLAGRYRTLLDITLIS